jgi:hypothetical protein
MEEARAVLARLERIEALDRAGTPAEVLLDELRALVSEAEAWVRVEPCSTEAAEDAVERLKAAVRRPPMPAGAREGLC